MRFFAFLLLLLSPAVRAGVVNPDISAIGQVLGEVTDDGASPDQNQPALKSGEAEIVLDAYLNPYFKGWFTLSGSEQGFEVEEAHTSWVKGLPWGLALKAGKYRLGFGKINPMHPHALPFLETPRSWVSLLPGAEEGFNETAVQVSALLPTRGDWASTLSADVIQGGTFHPGDSLGRTRLGWMGRWSNAFLLGETGALETGVSAATGLDKIGPDKRGYLLGADAKAKFYLAGASQLTVQAEGVFRRGHGMDTAAGTFPAENRRGGYAFADYRFHTQYNGGVLYEQWESTSSSMDQSIKIFAGYAVLEESALLRVAFEYFMPDGGSAVNTVSAQLVFSMGPHKAHQF